MEKRDANSHSNDELPIRAVELLQISRLFGFITPMPIIQEGSQEITGYTLEGRGSGDGTGYWADPLKALDLQKQEIKRALREAALLYRCAIEVAREARIEDPTTNETRDHTKMLLRKQVHQKWSELSAIQGPLSKGAIERLGYKTDSGLREALRSFECRIPIKNISVGIVESFIRLREAWRRHRNTTNRQNLRRGSSMPASTNATSESSPTIEWILEHLK